MDKDETKEIRAVYLAFLGIDLSSLRSTLRDSIARE